MTSANVKPASSQPAVTIAREGEIAIVTLNLASQRNPLNPELVSGLFAALDEVERDQATRAVVLTGAGSVFCAGAQLGVVIHPDGLEGEHQFQILRDCFRLSQRIRELDLPVIAAVNGPAVGGGAALALACDLAIAAPTASYYFAFGRVGAAGCDMGAAYFLPRLVGTMRAKHWLLSGATVDAQAGKEAGLFLDVCPKEELLARAREIGKQIAQNSPRRATAATKFTVTRAEEVDFQTCINYDTYVQTFMFTLDEHKQRLGKLMSERKIGR